MQGWRLALIAVMMPLTHAQSPDSSDRGVLTGSARDSNGHPLSGIKVYLERSGEKEFLATQTDANGVYRFTVLRGAYTVHAESEGKGEASAGPFVVARNKVTTIDLVLRPSAAEQPQFSDEPAFTVAGVTDYTYRGAHGSGADLRSAEALAKATASLSGPSPNADAAEPHHTAAETDERSGHPLLAVQEFQRAAELNPSEPNLFDWGVELLTHRAPQPAAEVFTKGVRLFPQSVRMLLGLATAWYAAGLYEQAGQCFFKGADLDPSDPNPYLFLGKVQSREITQSDGYEERMARFARLQPGSALANYYYAVSIWNRSRGPEDSEASKKAQTLLERAVALDPHLGSAYLQLGIIAARQGKYSDAIRAYRKAAEASPELEEVHYRLSEVYRLTGDRVEANQELAIYNRLSKQSAEKRERERREIQQFVVALRSQSPVTQTKQPQ
ncbi:MAG: tetratricopeptide repeat protein [Bryobacteraceae bacterium]